MAKFDRSRFVMKFAQEAREHLEQLNRGILALEKHPEDDAVFGEILRAAHTLKGSSRMLRFLDVNQIAHKTEDLLGEVKSGKVVLRAEVCDVLFRALDRIGGCVDRIVGGGEGDLEVGDICKALERAGKGGEIPVEEPPKAKVVVTAPSKTAPKVKEGPDQSSQKAAVKRPRPKFDRSRFVMKFAQEAREHLEHLNRGMLSLEKNPEDNAVFGDILRAAHTLKGSSRMLKFEDVNQIAHKMEDLLGEVKSGKVELRAEVCDVLFRALDRMGGCVDGIVGGGAGDLHVGDICEALESAGRGDTPEFPKQAHDTVEKQANEASGKVVHPGVPPVVDVIEAIPSKELGGAEELEEERTPVKVEETIRIGTSRLDTTIRLAGEVMVNGMRLMQRLGDLDEMRGLMRSHHIQLSRYLDKATGPRSDLEALFEESLHLSSRLDNTYRRHREDLASLDQMTGELQEKALAMRMLPLSTIFDAFPRTIRDLCRSLRKEVDVIIEGGETQLDKKIIEKLDGPMVHLIRNCIDHGIEEPEERKKAGKREKGILRIVAHYEGSRIAIEVEDDGRGMNLEAIRKKALQRGLMDEAALAAASDREIIDLLFLPGFSTAPIITDMSGRGIGLDVAKSVVEEELKGTVSLDSKEGKGTRFVLNLPLTLTTIRVMLVAAGGLTFAIPMGSILETVKVHKTEIIQVVDRDAIRLRNQIVPIVDLGRLLGVPGSQGADGKDLFIVIADSAGENVGFIVDAIVNEWDTLIKPLPEHLRRTPNISGVSIFEGNRIAIILHVPDMIESMRELSESRTEKKAVVQQERWILVVDDSLNTREIEKSILEAHGYNVVLARDGVEALGKAKKKNYDLVVADIEMPRMDGFTLIEHLREKMEYQDTPIVIVTSREKEEDKRRGIEVGADAYIVKGAFDQTNLIDTVQNLIS